MLGAIGLGLVKGFTRNIKEEKLRRIADQEKVDSYEQAVFNLIANSANDPNSRMTEAAANALQGMVRNARGKLNEREAIDMFGTQSEALDIDFTSDMASIMPLLKPVKEEGEEGKNLTTFPYFYNSVDVNGNSLQAGMSFDYSKISTKADADGAMAALVPTIRRLAPMLERSPDLANKLHEAYSISKGIIDAAKLSKITESGGDTAGLMSADPVHEEVVNLLTPYLPKTGVDTTGQLGFDKNVTRAVNNNLPEDEQVSLVILGPEELGEELGQVTDVIGTINFDDIPNGNSTAELIYEVSNPSDLSQFLTVDQFGDSRVTPFRSPAQRSSVIFAQFGLTNSVAKKLNGASPSQFSYDNAKLILTTDKKTAFEFKKILENQASSIQMTGAGEGNSYLKQIQTMLPYVPLPDGIGDTPAKTEPSQKYAGMVKFTPAKVDNRKINAYYIARTTGVAVVTDEMIQNATKANDTIQSSLTEGYSMISQLYEAAQGLEGKNKAYLQIAKALSFAGEFIRSVVGGGSATAAEEFANSDFARKANFFGGEERELAEGDSYVTQQSLSELIARRMDKVGVSEGSNMWESYARYESLMISVAFSLARAADPSGRLSNQDIEAQLVKLGGPLDTREVADEKIRFLKKQVGVALEKAQKNSIFLRNTSKITDNDNHGARLVEAALAVDYASHQSNIHELEISRQKESSEGLEANIYTIPQDVSRTAGPNVFVYVDNNGKTKVNESGETLYYVRTKDGSIEESTNPQVDFVELQTVPFDINGTVPPQPNGNNPNPLPDPEPENSNEVLDSEVNITGGNASNGFTSKEYPGKKLYPKAGSSGTFVIR
jgi:hypothetical protein